MIKIRLAKSSDLTALLAIEKLCFNETGDNFSAQTFRYFINKSLSKCLVISENTSIFGYCVLMLRKNSTLARIYSIALNPNYQGKNLGQRLLEAMEKLAKQANRETIILEVRKDNLRAQNFYKKNGYMIYGEYKSYYYDGTDAFRMKKDF